MVAQSPPGSTSDLLEKLSSAFFKLLDELTIARSRRHIQRYYKDTIAELGGFPERLRPISIYPKIDLKGRFPSYDKINDEISEYQLSLFNPAKYVLPQYQQLYDRGRSVFSQGDREHFLIGMMKVNFLKRLESSVSAFAITMDNTIQKIEGLQERIKRFQTLRSQNAEVEATPMTVAELDDEELWDAMQVGQKLVYQMVHLDAPAWLKDLDRDKDQLVGLHNSASAIFVDRDAKLAELKKLIAQKVQHPTINKQEQPNRKVLVFTFANHLQAENLPTLDDLKGNKLTALRTIFHCLYAQDHPIRQNLFALDTLPVIRLIEGKA